MCEFKPKLIHFHRNFQIQTETFSRTTKMFFIFFLLENFEGKKNTYIENEKKT